MYSSTTSTLCDLVSESLSCVRRMLLQVVGAYDTIQAHCMQRSGINLKDSM
jgi:hypothetical protein